MGKLFLFFSCIFCYFLSTAQNTFPSSGNVGIGTTNPKGNLDVYDAYYSHGYKFIDNVLSNSSVGFLNPIAMALRQGKKLFPDEEFAYGLNGIYVYDNHHTNQTTITRTNTITDLPNSSGYGLVITHRGSDEAPGFGGFYQLIHSGINKTIVQIFRAKLPAGYRFREKSNSIGSEGKNYWLSNTEGTGKWEWYIRVIQCGNGGTFSTSGHVCITGSPAPTSTSPLIWYMSSCTAFDITDVNDNEGNYILNQNSNDQDASIRVSGNGIFGGNVGIGTTMPQSKLAVNGTITAQKVKVTQTGWPDFVFDSAYQLPSLGSIEVYIKANHHLHGFPTTKEIKISGLDIGEIQKKQMQKIEELMLYLIRQNKLIQKQQKEIKLLKNRLAQLEINTTKLK